MHNWSKDHCSPKYDVPRRQRQSPFPRYSRGFQSHSRGITADTAVIPQIPLQCHSLVLTAFHWLIHHQAQGITSCAGISGSRRAVQCHTVNGDNTNSWQANFLEHRYVKGNMKQCTSSICVFMLAVKMVHVSAPYNKDSHLQCLAKVYFGDTLIENQTFASVLNQTKRCHLQ